MKILILFLHTLMVVTTVTGQELQEQSLSKEDYRQDFIVFRNFLQTSYPSLYRYVRKKKMNALLDSCYASLNDETTSLDFYRTIKYLLSAVGDGHLSCRPSAAIKQYLEEEAALFPLSIHFTGHEAYMLHELGNGITAGTEIISINNEPVDRIRQQLFRYMAADGAIETKKYVILNNVFRFYYAFVYGGQNTFSIVFRTAAGETITRKIHGLPEKDLAVQQTDTASAKKLLDLQYTRDSIAVLTIKTFSKTENSNAGEDLPAFLHTAFSDITRRNVNRLIIDLRGNGGGRDLYGSLLYTYLANKKFAWYKSLVTATTGLPFAEFSSTTSSYSDLTPTMLTKTSGHQYAMTANAHAGLQYFQPDANQYKGRVWFLTDGMSFSTTAEFCAIARSHKRGKFIGTETGGAYNGNTSGVQIDTLLPKTGISISFGTVQYNMAVKKVKPANRGVIPDYPAVPAIENLLQGRDVVYEYALSLVRTGKQQ